MSIPKLRISYELRKAREISLLDPIQSITWDKINSVMEIGFGNDYRGLDYLMKRNIERDNIIICCLTEKKDIIAIAFMRPSGKKDGTIVHPEYQRRGIGKKLITYSQKHFPNQLCVTNTKNTAAIQLLLSCGFRYVQKMEILELYLTESQISDIKNLRIRNNNLEFDRVNKNTNSYEHDFTALVYTKNGNLKYRMVYLPGKQGDINEGKIKLLRLIAKEQKILFTVIDYKKLNSLNNSIDYAINVIKEKNEKIILCGSSMGGYISIVLSNYIESIYGILLLAPAIGIDGYPDIETNIKCKNVKVIHGYNDDMVPYENVINFCINKKIEMHLVNDNHRLTKSYKLIGQELLSLILNLYG